MTPHRVVKKFIEGMGYVRAKYIPVYYINIGVNTPNHKQTEELRMCLKKAETKNKYVAALFLFHTNNERPTHYAMWMYRDMNGIRYEHLLPGTTGPVMDDKKPYVTGALLYDNPSALEGLSFNEDTVNWESLPDQFADMDHGMQCLCWAVSHYTRVTGQPMAAIPDDATIARSKASIDWMIKNDVRPEFGDVAWMAPPADRLKMPTTYTEYITYAMEYEDEACAVTSTYTSVDDLMRICEKHATPMEYYRGHAHQSSTLSRVTVHVLSIQYADAFFPTPETLQAMITKFRHSHLEPFADDRPPSLPYVWFHAMPATVRDRYATNAGIRNSSQVSLSLVPLHEYILYRDMFCMSMHDITQVTRCCADRRDELIRRTTTE